MTRFTLAITLFLGATTAQQSGWGQCGGKGWTGPTTCVSGWTCSTINEYYFQCVPAASGGGGGAPTTAKTTLVTSTTTKGSAPTSVVPPVQTEGVGLKPRMIVLSDVTSANWEPDDLQSLVHLCASADLIEIEGFISVTGWSLDYPDKLQTYHFNDVIDGYAKDLPKLMKRSGQSSFRSDESQQTIGYWPSAAYLKSVVRSGLPGRGMGWVGDGKATEGSNWIISVVDQPDNRPVYITMWGGGNTLAQAIWDVRRTRTPAQLKAFLAKIRVHAIVDQDRGQDEGYSNSAQFWMRKNFPELFYIFSASAWGTYGSSINMNYWDKSYASKIQGRGALGALYPKYKYITEGDSPSWLWLWPGLNDPEDPSQYSFGGRFVYGTSPDGSTKAYTDASGDAASRSNNAIKNTLPDQVNDFIARMDWAATGAGNRNPKIVIQGNAGYSPVTVNAAAGSTVKLSTAGSVDPDGNAISYSWSQDTGAGYSGSVSVGGANTDNPSISIPSGAGGQKIHIVLRATDNGQPSLASYRRVIIAVN